MKKNKPLPSMKTRLLGVNIAFVFFAFLVILLAFNLLISSYITRNATNQLSSVVHFQSSQESAQSTSPSAAPNLNNAPRGFFNTHPVGFHMTSSYQVVEREATSTLDEDNNEKIAAALKEKSVSLNGLKNYRLSADGDTFYVETSRMTDGSYMVIYVDMTGIVNFAASVNLFLIIVALIIIVLLAAAITLVTNRMVSPLTRLATFARRMGHGDFTAYEAEFNSRELATLANTMNAAAAQLDRNDKDQKAFFQNASHELRTPLMAIKSYAEGISYDVIPPKDASKVILAETDNMSELVEDLLTLSRLDSLTDQQEFDTVNLQELLQNIVDEQAPIAEQKNVKIQAKFDKKTVFLSANRKALRRAVSNLISNGIRYAKSTLTVMLSADKTEIKISISNDGPSISADDLPHIFERFYKGNGGVHGIGLSIVKAVVLQHQGEIDVESDAAATTFIMRFPLQ